jgi:sulfhydrogenase subunit alpha
MKRTIDVEELTRVEGHGRVLVVIDGEEVKDVNMAIFEGPRFFESFIETVKYDKVPDVMRRICAICTASHSMASIRTIEKAFNVKATQQTKLLRDLLIHGEMIESHALHVFMLALPDYLGFPDAVRMTSKYPKEVKAALQLKRAGNMVHNVVSGREVHGMNERVGGFSKIPSDEALKEIRMAMAATKPTAELAADLFAKLEAPKFAESDNMFMALDPGKRFGFFGDYVLISDGTRHPVEKYESLTNEQTVKHCHAKLSSYKNSSFMVGALPRVFLNKDKLEGTAAMLFDNYKNLLSQKNTLANNLAQAIELVHSVDRCIEDIDALLSDGLKDEGLVEIDVKAARGIGAVEAPRGILYHDYIFDNEGCIVKCNVITPTAQNAYNMEKDYRVAAKRLIKQPDDKIVNALELIARAYDPCISCSVHLTHIKK